MCQRSVAESSGLYSSLLLLVGHVLCKLVDVWSLSAAIGVGRGRVLNLVVCLVGRHGELQSKLSVYTMERDATR